MKDTDISIYCLTYNHVQFISDAIKGFLMQETEYSYHIFIYDDASNDGTSEIVREYQNKYSDLIDVYRPDRNNYKEEARKGFPEREKIKRRNLTGKYIAVCEGDDCWIDPHKLQTQVSFLETHPECVMTVHDAWWLDCRTGEKKKYSVFDTTGYLTCEDIILKGTEGIPTASFVMRNEIYFLSKNFPQCEVGDFPRQLYAITKGSVYFFNKKMAMYRFMRAGSWSALYTDDRLYALQFGLKMIEFLLAYDMYTKRQFHLSVRTKINAFLSANFLDYIDTEEAKSCVKKCIQLIEEENRINKALIQKMKYIWNLLFNLSYVDRNIEHYLKKYKNVVVVGAGKFSGILTKYLDNQKIKYLGYIVSNDQTVPENQNKKIWRIQEYPYSWKETGILIALHPRWQEEIEKSLQEGGVYSYYAPFWIEDDCFN